MKTSKFLLTTVIFFSVSALYAAPAPPPSTTGGTGAPVCWPPPCVPVDNGVIFLIIAGALYGAKKIYDAKKASQTIS